jgi:hypothetical protein
MEEVMKNCQQRMTQVALVATILLASIPAWSQGSLSTWVDACHVTDADLLQLLENEALLVPAYALTDNHDGTYQLASQTYTEGWNGEPLCGDSLFYGQIQESETAPFRSAVQIGPDLIVTAWHSAFPLPFDPLLAAVFGLRYSGNSSNCVAPDFDHVPAANVFWITEAVADAYPYDYLVLRLDRNANSTYPRIRRSGQGRVGDDLTSIGHPDRLATKVDLAGTLLGHTTGPHFENLHSLIGSSGSMIYNRDERFIETIASQGPYGSHYYFDNSSDPGCYRTIHDDGTFWTNYSTTYVSQYIPAFELLVTPLDTVVHEGCAGGPFTNPTTSRTIHAPVTAPGNIDYEVHLPGTTQPQVLTTFDGDLQGTLEPTGDGLVITETIDANTAPCGNYEWTYTVTDATNGFTDTIRHKFIIHGTGSGCVACSP